MTPTAPLDDLHAEVIEARRRIHAADRVLALRIAEWQPGECPEGFR